MLNRTTVISTLLLSLSFVAPAAFAGTTQHNSYQVLPAQNEIVTKTDFGYQTYIFHFTANGQRLSSIDFVDHMETQAAACKNWLYVPAFNNLNVADEVVLRVSTNYNPSTHNCTAHAYAGNNGGNMDRVLALFQKKEYVDIAGFNLSANGFTSAVEDL
ncbi:hypothetical protein AYY19_02280 [Photobacterium aquimaris]|uniref:Uncharacterized protein n=1 Tax=Photobacterium malacitanum TaxID=2204294 RepID=A0A1Y6M908_9GAMM|nr:MULTISPECIES: hypothetical protein [Photobacterium]OBU14850.1 hypothetical protein AYY20_08260 [Photobacterium aquimaris]OBU18715.1 hypothetical protein AYY19_02280 [Photobacterium aquimaris]SMY33036.1 hypothetical protein PMAL9190_00832 [Photobacterium malacitanum]